MGEACGMSHQTDRKYGPADREARKQENLDLIGRAVLFAAMKHAGQTRKGSGTPYITHVMEAMAIVSEMTDDQEIQAAALLHDTLEDTDTTKEQLVHYFGERVADLVAAESENKRRGQRAEDTWEIRKQETLDHLREAPTDVKIITMGDKLSNMRAMSRDYKALGGKLWDRFNQKDPAMHGWYYRSIGEILGEDGFIRSTEAYKEYVGLCEETFGAGEGRTPVPEKAVL